MDKLRTWEEVRQELLSDPETAKEYNKLRSQYEEVIKQIIKKREEQGITQEESEK